MDDADNQGCDSEENVASSIRNKNEAPFSQVSRISEKFETPASSNLPLLAFPSLCDIDHKQATQFAYARHNKRARFKAFLRGASAFIRGASAKLAVQPRTGVYFRAYLSHIGQI